MRQVHSADKVLALMYYAGDEFEDFQEIFDLVKRAKDKYPEMFEDIIYSSRTVRNYSSAVDEATGWMGIANIIGYKFARGEPGIFFTKNAKKYIEEDVLTVFTKDERKKLKECAVNTGLRNPTPGKEKILRREEGAG